MAAGPEHQPTIGQLVSQATADVQSLVRSQIELTKAELSTTAKQAITSSGLLIGAGVLGFLGFVFLLVTAAEGLIAAGLAPWLSFLIVALVLIIIAGILGFLGKRRLERMQGPTRSIEQLNETKAAFSSLGRSVKESAPEISTPALPESVTESIAR